ncbi:MAG: hypothetical protein ACI382_02695 [Alloprevotella sp.]
MTILEFMSENLGYILSALGIGGGASIFTAYYSRQQAKADISQSVQDVYQEMLNDVKADRDELKAEIVGLRIEVNELRRMLPMICRKMDCLQRDGLPDGKLHEKPDDGKPATCLI